MTAHNVWQVYNEGSNTTRPPENRLVLVRLSSSQWGNPPIRLARYINGQWESQCSDDGVSAIDAFVTHWHEIPPLNE